MKKKYVVKVVNVFSNLIEVEANHEEEAKQKAKQILLNERQIPGELMIKISSSVTLPEEYWTVITKEKFDKLKGIEELTGLPSESNSYLSCDLRFN